MECVWSETDRSKSCVVSGACLANIHKKSRQYLLTIHCVNILTRIEWNFLTARRKWRRCYQIKWQQSGIFGERFGINWFQKKELTDRFMVKQFYKSAYSIFTLLTGNSCKSENLVDRCNSRTCSLRKPIIFPIIGWISFVIGTDTGSANYRKNSCKWNIHYVVQTYYLTGNSLRVICV